MRRNLVLLAFLIIVLGVSVSSGVGGISWHKIGLSLPQVEAPKITQTIPGQEKVRVVTEESVVIDAVKKVGPSVVTIGIIKQQLVNPFSVSPFDPFGLFPQPQTQQKKVEQNIGSGFIVSQDGMIVTNKHVVSDTEAKYRVVTADNKAYDVKKIYRDPANDLAILKIDSPVNSGFKPVEMGDSSNLQVGQMAIAIGTALGEFRNTVTRGVISGLGRGITAGSPFEGSERLDDVIQTDAAINPGNSGGPLLNSAGQVIGVNVAVATEAQSIGFALPINLVKESLKNFESTGSFTRAFLGVKYKVIGRDTALLNDVPEGAYVVDISSGSPAEKAGIQKGDIITKLNGQAVRESDGGLAQVLSKKKSGERVELNIWRDGKESKLNVTLGESTGE